MGKIPDYVGVSAFGIKLGVIVPGSDIVEMVSEAMRKCDRDGFLDDGDTVCITESIVARAQNNYVTVSDIARDVQDKLKVKPGAKIGVLFPILSRNRFSLILKGLATAVKTGEVVVQLSYPADEVGNQLISLETLEKLGKGNGEVITPNELGEPRFLHPITGVDYIQLYQDVIAEAGCRSQILLCNDPLKMTEMDLDGIVVANVHHRHRALNKLNEMGVNCIGLQDICRDTLDAWSEWGLLGSNMSSGDKLKLAPRDADYLAEQVQQRVKQELGKNIEVIVYGDGAYRDPSTGIYELADPQPALGITAGLKGRYREGVKYKYLVDKMWDEGVEIEEIEKSLQEKKQESLVPKSIETEGTTPRKVEDLIASLADLVSGSADAGTPVILVKSFMRR
ncbi:coenzyme F420-0:L-glutamate ligase [Syntrophomonas erecta]